MAWRFIEAADYEPTNATTEAKMANPTTAAITYFTARLIRYSTCGVWAMITLYPGEKTTADLGENKTYRIEPVRSSPMPLTATNPYTMEMKTRSANWSESKI